MRERINKLAFLLRASPKRTTALAGFLLVILAIPLTVAVSQRQQNLEQEAATSQCTPGEEQCIGTIIYGCHTVAGVGRWDNETGISQGVDCAPKGATCKPDAGKTRAYSCIANPVTPPPPTGTTCAQAGGVCKAGGCAAGSSEISGDCVATNNKCCSIVSPNPTTCTQGQEKCVSNVVLSCNGSSGTFNTSGENCSTFNGGGRTCIQDLPNQWSCIANCMVSGVGTCRVTTGGNCPLNTTEVFGPNATGCNTGSKCCKPGGPTPTPTPTPQGGTPPQCTLVANPNTVNPNGNSNLSATCSGNPDTFTWTETCGVSVKVNSPNTTWQAPPNPGNCSVSVNACNSAGCSKPSTTIQVISPTPAPTASPTPGTPPSCTLVANPNTVVVNGNSALTATCTGNPNTFTWTETCGVSVKVNSPTTSWKAPASPGNCTVSVNACNNVGCSKPSAPIKVVDDNATTLALSIGLDGLGSTGDDRNPNPIANSNPIYRSNPDPIHKTRDIKIVIKNSSGAQVDSMDSTITFAQDGKFKTTIPLKSDFATGTYSITVRVPNYIEETIVSSLQITKGARNVPVAGNLSTGDIDNNNELTILDYNILISCYIYSPNTGACNANNRTISDLTDNGVNDHDDYNLHLRDWFQAAL